MDGRTLDAVRMLAHLLAGSGRHEAACDLWRGLLAADGADAQARRGLVRSLLCLGRYAEAEPDAGQLAAGEAEGANTRIAALFFHAHALWGCGRMEECRAVVDRYAALARVRDD